MTSVRSTNMAAAPVVPRSPLSRRAGSSWRGSLRIATAVYAALLLSYIYIAHLASLDWTHFPVLHPVAAGQSRKMVDYIVSWDIATAFDLLKGFSFSAAMLPASGLYFYGMAPPMVVQLFLEKDRVSRLKKLVAHRLPRGPASHVAKWLDMFFFTLSVGYTCFLSLGLLHIDMPLWHYLASGSGLACITASIGLYVAFPLDFDAVARGDAGLVAWVAQVRSRVKPVLTCVLVLTVLCFASAAWKCERLGDDTRALVFGVLETVVIIGYQAVVGVFAVDDEMLDKMESRGLPQHCVDIKEFPDTLMGSSTGPGETFDRLKGT